jgi:hypothetical protein
MFEPYYTNKDTLFQSDKKIASRGFVDDYIHKVQNYVSRITLFRCSDWTSFKIEFPSRISRKPDKETGLDSGKKIESILVIRIGTIWEQ